MKVSLTVLAVLLCALSADAANYPVCSQTQSPTSCTIPISCGGSSTPLFDKLIGRQYLLVHNQGFFNATAAALPVCISVGTQNHCVWDNTHLCNGWVIQPGQNWEPWLFTTPQTSFRVPPGDISCCTPFGNVGVTGEEE